MQDLRAAVATPALQEAVGSASGNTLFILTSVALVERTAVCGNQVSWELWLWCCGSNGAQLYHWMPKF